MRTGAGDIIALDGKVSLDENGSEVRHPENTRNSSDKTQRTRWRLKAKKLDLNYVKLDGQVGIIGNGAGLVMSTLDVVAYAGEDHGGVKPANFLDIGGGATAEVMANGLDVILGDDQVKSVFVNVFGGITSVRRSRRRHREGARDPRRFRDQADRRAPRRQSSRGGARDPRRRRTTLSSPMSAGMDERSRQGRRARERLRRRDSNRD